MADKLVYAASGATLPDPGGIPEMALVTGDVPRRLYLPNCRRLVLPCPEEPAYLVAFYSRS